MEEKTKWAIKGYASILGFFAAAYLVNIFIGTPASALVFLGGIPFAMRRFSRCMKEAGHNRWAEGAEASAKRWEKSFAHRYGPLIIAAILVIGVLIGVWYFLPRLLT